MIQTAAAAATASQQIGRKTPRPVATPFPPLNFSQTGNMCPITARTAAAIIQRALPPVQRPAIQTDRQPFPASKSRVRVPASAPALGATLAAPILPLPLER